MLIESEIEAAIIAKLKTALEGVPGVRIEGAWQAAADGEVKGEENPSDRVIVGVAVGAPSYETYLTPMAEIPVALAVVVRRELAPTAAEVAEVMAPIARVLLGYQFDEPDGLSTDHFRADGVRLDPGEPPAYVAARKVWRVTRSFSVKGCASLAPL